VGVAVEGGLDFVSADQIPAAAGKAGLDPATTAALVEDYSKAQLGSLKVALLTMALLALLALMSTRELPHDPTGRAPQRGGPGAVPVAGLILDRQASAAGLRMRRGPLRMGES
jgi:hypothetical protein